MLLDLDRSWLVEEALRGEKEVHPFVVIESVRGCHLPLCALEVGEVDPRRPFLCIPEGLDQHRRVA